MGRLEELKGLVLEKSPKVKFKVKPSSQKDLWHLYIYTPEGNLQMPPEVMRYLDSIWREQRITVVTVIYPLSMYEEEQKA